MILIKKTGVVSVNRDKMWGTWSLDFEKRNVYPLRIKATDIPRKGDPMTDTALLTMFLVDIVEMVKKAKGRHKKEKYKGDFNITVEDIVKLKQNNKCKLTGNELIWQCYQDPFYMVSLDRFI